MPSSSSSSSERTPFPLRHQQSRNSLRPTPPQTHQPPTLPQLPTTTTTTTTTRARISSTTIKLKSPLLSPTPLPPPPLPRQRSHTITSNTSLTHSSPPPPPPPPKPPKPLLHFNQRSPNIPDRVPHPIGPREWTPTHHFNSPTHRSADSNDSHSINRYFTTPDPPPHQPIATKKRSSLLGIGFPTSSSSSKPRSPLLYDSDDDDDFDEPDHQQPPPPPLPPPPIRHNNLPYGSFPPPPPPPPASSSSASSIYNRHLSRALSGSWLESPIKMDGKQSQYIPAVARFHNSAGKVEDMPDPTFANRRPPTLNPPVSISIGSQFSCWALRGNWLCTGHHQLKLWNATTGDCLVQANSNQDIKITCMEFKATTTSSSSHNDNQGSRYVWCGTKDGQLFEFDCVERRILDSRATLHSTPVVGIFRCKEGGMCSIDENAKVQIWSSPTSGNSSSSSLVKISGSPRAQRIAEKTNFVKMISHRLWTASGPSGSKTAPALAQRGPSIRVYDPDPSRPWTVTPRPICIPEAVIGGIVVGMVTAGAVVPSRPELIYLGHESGHVSVWETNFGRSSPSSSKATHNNSNSHNFPGTLTRSKTELKDIEPIKFRKLIKLSNYQITAMEGVTKYLWVGFRTGNVYVYEPEIPNSRSAVSQALLSDNRPTSAGNQPSPHPAASKLNYPSPTPVPSWKVLKVWRAHKEAVLKIIVDPSLLWDEVGKLHVATTSTDWKVKLWDGTMSVDWLAREMRKRQTEYCTYRPIKALICSWNVDACKPSDLRGTCDNLNFLEDVLKSSFTPDQPTSATHHSADPPPPKQSSSSANTSKFPLNSRTPPAPPPSSTTTTNTRNAPDLIVFGFQEMIDLENKKLTAKTVLLGGRKKAAGNSSSSGVGSSSGGGNSEKLSDSVSQVYRKWHDKLVATVRTFMPPDDPYVVIHTENLVGLFTCVFVKSSERAKMRDIAVTTVKTGMKGRYGNKGAILARLVIDDSSICFINCHLAAGQKHVRQRNSDLIDILEEKSGFPDPPERATTTSHHSNSSQDPSGSKNKKEMVEMSSGVYVGGGNGSSISDHEICFLQGDLNYRIDAQREDVIRAIAAGEYWKLLEFDQLSREKKLNPSCRLRAFNEPPIRFHPTYKYDPGTHMYDSSEKARVPAWCDRILYRTPIEESGTGPGTIYIQQQQQQEERGGPKAGGRGGAGASTSTSTTTRGGAGRAVSGTGTVPVTRLVESLDYRRYEVNISDHRPVSATFQILVKAVVPGLKRLVRDLALEKWSDHEAQILADARSYYSRL